MLGEMLRTQQQLNRLFSGLRLGAAQDFPPVNVWVSAEGALLTASVPGVPVDQIDVTVHQNTLTLRGKRDPEAVDEQAVVHRQERVHGPFSRTVVLPFRVDSDKVSARCERGVLIAELPRPAADKPRQIKIASA